MSSDPSISQRTCKHCQRSLPLISEYWHRDKTDKYGFSYSCKECAKARSHKWLANNRERNKETCKRRYYENQDAVHTYREAHRQHDCDYKRAWRKANPEKAKAHKSASQKRNRASTNERTKRWNKRNPEKVRILRLNRIARKKTAPGKFTKTDIDLQYRSQKGLCWWCGKPMGKDYQIDHRVPLSKGGTNDPRNLCLTHGRCNMSKGDKMPWDYNGRLL